MPCIFNSCKITFADRTRLCYARLTKFDTRWWVHSISSDNERLIPSPLAVAVRTLITGGFNIEGTDRQAFYDEILCSRSDLFGTSISWPFAPSVVSCLDVGLPKPKGTVKYLPLPPNY